MSDDCRTRICQKGCMYPQNCLHEPAESSLAAPAVSADALRYAANEVAKLAAHLVGNTKTDGTRDPIVYEQGIGCELASKMLLEQARIIERVTAQHNLL